MGLQTMVTVNEPDLYTLIMRSRKPEAVDFIGKIGSNIHCHVRRIGHFGEESMKNAGTKMSRGAVIPKDLPGHIQSRRFLTTSLTTFVVTGDFQRQSGTIGH